MNRLVVYKLKMTLVVTFILTFLMSIFVYLHIEVSKTALEKSITSFSKVIAYDAAQLIAQDLTGYRQFRANPDIKSAYYKKMNGLLNSIAKHSAVDSVYSEMQVDENHAAILLDSDLPGAKNHFKPMSVKKMARVQKEAYLEQKEAISPFSEEAEYGLKITAYAPIVDPETQEFLGLTSVDFLFADYEASLNSMRLIGIVCALIFAVLAFFSMAIVSSAISNPLVFDHLTKLYNKRFFQKELTVMRKKEQRKKQSIALMMADLDFFKRINDTYGHPFGDVVLARTAHLLQSSLKEIDLIARYGGEEFVIAIPNCDAQNAIKIADRLREAVSVKEIENNETKEKITMTISIGVAIFNPNDTDIEATLKNADQALYQAKIKRNNSVLYPNLG